MGAGNRKNKNVRGRKYSKLKQIELLFAGIELLLLLLILCLVIEKTRYSTRRFHTLSGTISDSVTDTIDEVSVPNGEFRIPILMYHYVEYVQDEKDTIRYSLTIPPDVFEKQVVTLKHDGYTFLTVSELGEIFNGRMKIPEKPVLLTIDDGHWDVYTDILPILQRYRIKATLYVVPGLLGGSDFLSTEQLQAVIDSGIFEIGAHSMNHFSLPQLSSAEKRSEVYESKTSLERTFHIRVRSFAYPNGEYDEDTLSMVKDAGYTTAVSTIPGISQSRENQYTLYRLRPGRRTGVELTGWLQQDAFGEYALNR